MHQLWVYAARVLRVVIVVVVVAAGGAVTVSGYPPNASASAQEDVVLDYLYGISGTRTVSGQHNREPNSAPATWTNEVHNITGRYPGLWGGDFLFAQPDITSRPTMVAEAKHQWQQGALVTLMWHVCPPTMAEPCAWGSGIQSDLSDTQWAQLITNGSSLNTAWKARLDAVVPYLQDLEDSGVEVLWRFLHEMNDGWAWWGGRPGPNGSRKLYQITHDYLTNVKGLSNLVWVWNVQDTSVATIGDYYPGDSYVDVASMDIWTKSYPSTQDYNAMLAVAHGKPIALGEVGKLPSPAVLAAQPKWAWFMVWAEYLTNNATHTEIQQTYSDARVLTRDEIDRRPSLARDAPILASSQQGAQWAPQYANDGNRTTRWSSTNADQQWIYVDLGYPRPVNRVVLDWEFAYARQYQIQVSTDGVGWTTVYTDDFGNGGADTVVLTPVTARYVKMYAWTRGTVYGYSLWEFGVYEP